MKQILLNQYLNKENLCLCGCCKNIHIGRKFVHGHNNSRFKGGWTDDLGYKRLCINSVVIREHRLIMERFLGRRLLSTEHIHHKNKDKLDNRIENLEIIDIKMHGSLEGKKSSGIPKFSLRKELKYLCCLNCGVEFAVIHHKQKYCSHSCYSTKKSSLLKDYRRIAYEQVS